ncbi:hypothetical protein PIB30_047082 [Stylosanthes scabra]|uniref:Uncharacterized protein n=1 Tax=Stylosanthes scabra TaxID=79078 RepID=A0ABU6WIB7_9FABA|nr:hypothetical protein [Stylosanthes scabra]
MLGNSVQTLSITKPYPSFLETSSPSLTASAPLSQSPTASSLSSPPSSAASPTSLPFWFLHRRPQHASHPYRILPPTLPPIPQLFSQTRIALNWVAKFCPKVSNFEVIALFPNRSSFTTDFELIASCFPNLEELDLTLCKARDQPDGGDVVAVFGGAVEAMGSKLQKLRKVKLCLSFLHRGTFILHFCRNCVSLEELHLGCMPSLLEQSLEQNAIAEAIRERPGLRSLKVNATRQIVSSELIDALLTLKMLTFLDLVLIAECFPNLEEIHVTFTSVYSETDLQVKALTSGLKKLRKVYLSGSYILQDSSIFTLCQNCVSLEALVVHQTGSLSEIANAIRERPQLRSLEARGGILTLELINTLVSLKCLTCLHLSGSSISDEALCALADEVLPLRELSLWGCSGYQYSGISCLLRKCNNLQHLDLQDTEFLNDECVIELSLLLGNLNVVKLGGNANLTDLSLFAIMRNCPLITEISMERNSVGKQKVEEDCLVVNSHVKFLYLARNYCLNDESVKMIASVCPNLEIIDLTNCKRVSKGVIDILQRCCNIQRMDMICLGYDLSQF